MKINMSYYFLLTVMNAIYLLFNKKLRCSAVCVKLEVFLVKALTSRCTDLNNLIHINFLWTLLFAKLVKID